MNSRSGPACNSSVMMTLTMTIMMTMTMTMTMMMIMMMMMMTMAMIILAGEQGWCSSESTLLPPMWPWFDSWSRRHMWVEFVVGSLLALRGFSPGTPVFPSSQKQTF